MLAKLRSMAVMGIDAFEIGIEADISEMLPSFTIVGLPGRRGAGEPRARHVGDQELRL